MTIEIVSESRCFGGIQGTYRHPSITTGTTMQFALYRPPGAARGPVPVLWYLSGLTCTEENFTVKAGAQRYAAEHGLMLVAPDTSPRGEGVPDDDAYDFGQGAGFYIDATAAPWSDNFRMYSYVVGELSGLVFDNFPGRPEAQGIFGHSMGGHGAMTIALRHPETFRSLSAFAPICAPLQCPWGQKAFDGYLGGDLEAARGHDTTALIADGARFDGAILVDQGEADGFLEEQLRPGLLDAACREAGQELELRLHPGYDHSYWFIASFIGEQIAWHARILKRI